MSVATTQPTPPGEKYVSASAFDLLLIELVPLAQRINHELYARHERLATQASLIHLFGPTGTSLSSQRRRRPVPSSNPEYPSTTIIGGGIIGDTNTVVTNTTTAEQQNDFLDESDANTTSYRLNTWGHRVGQGLVEAFSAETARPSTSLDAIKFVCKDLWTKLYRKQIDNLKTNHRGTFVLTDIRFGPITRISADKGQAKSLGGEKIKLQAQQVAIRKAQSFLWFSCGIIRGVLAGFGMLVEVTAECSELPVATFQIKVIGQK